MCICIYVYLCLVWEECKQSLSTNTIHFLRVQLSAGQWHLKWLAHVQLFQSQNGWNRVRGTPSWRAQFELGKLSAKQLWQLQQKSRRSPRIPFLHNSKQKSLSTAFSFIGKRWSVGSSGFDCLNFVNICILILNFLFFTHRSWWLFSWFGHCLLYSLLSF